MTFYTRSAKFGSMSDVDSGVADAEMPGARSATDNDVSHAERGQFIFFPELFFINAKDDAIYSWQPF